ncbi:MAG TPA: transposase [Myxococcaceae bacterium]|nr:transposase [Myxococcaceae bacterium]
MAYPLRMFIPEGIYFGTVRCQHGRLLLRPSRETNEVLGGVLARAARLYGVEVFAFAFASNHLHLLLRAPRGNLPKFMQYLLANIARKVGWLVQWRGRFWERRYSAEPVLDEEALLDRLRYILSHGVKEALVRRCRDWPGLSCLRMLVRGSRKTYQWFGWSKRWVARRDRESADRFHERWTELETLELTPLPQWTQTPRKRRARQVLELVRAAEKQAEAMHGRVLGRANVLAQNPHHRPLRPDRSPRPYCHGTRAADRRAFIELYRAYVASFRSASTKWRRGELTVDFPLRAIRPFLWPMVNPAVSSVPAGGVRVPVA